MIRPGLASLFLVAAGGASAQDLSVVAIQPIGPDGVAAPRLGDKSYGVQISLKAGAGAGPFRIKVAVADKTATIDVPGGGRWSYRRLFTMPLDGSIPYTVTLDPDGAVSDPDRRNNVASGSFTPAPPRSAIEYYDPRDLVATETLTTQFSQIGGLTDFTVLFGSPETATSQTVSDVIPPSGSSPIRTAPYGVPGFLAKLSKVPDTLTQTLSFRVRASNVRINADLIRDAWSSLPLVPREIRLYTEPEAKIQSAGPKIAAYVKANLPADYRTSLTPLQAARRLFCAVIRDTVYQSPSPSSALDTLDSGRGDCGGFSRLYVACMRSVGVPARLVCGWLKGDDRWHGWSEIYLPSVGWIPQDATFGDGNSPDGSFAYYFGIVPDLNARASVSRASTNGVGTARYDGDLQSPPQWSWHEGPVVPRFKSERSATLKDASPTTRSASQGS